MTTFTKANLTATYAGVRYTWRYWYDSQRRVWMLEDPERYVRALETTWRDSVPRIRTILANYGMEAEVS